MSRNGHRDFFRNTGVTQVFHAGSAEVVNQLYDVPTLADQAVRMDLSRCPQ